MENRIYLDHAATTPVDPRVLQKMLPYFTEKFGNPNSQHAFGRETVTAVDDARDTVASLIGAKPSEIYFTSGGTEADNWALRGTAHAFASRGKHLIVSAVEHPAMIATAKELQKEGFSVTFAEVDEYGAVDMAKLERAIRPDTTFVGVMTANNEVGTIQPVREIAALCKSRGVAFFTDAVQAAGGEVSFCAANMLRVFNKGEAPCGYTTDYESVCGSGRARIVTDEDGRLHGLNVLMRHYTGGEFAESAFSERALALTTVVKIEVSHWTGKRLVRE